MIRTAILRAIGPQRVSTLRVVRNAIFGRSTQTPLEEWQSRAFSMPAPDFVKRSAIKRNAILGGTFVETGTYMGGTALEASEYSSQVLTIEPDAALFERAAALFRDKPNITAIRGLSQDILPEILPTLSGDVTFWLDGHGSEGITYSGPGSTPIAQEVEAISPHINRLQKVVIMIDDLRQFGSMPGYPPVQYFVDWAVSMGLPWRVELDMLIIEKA